jgi:tRNA 2-thiocytidine biosynthesis protein TtcA
MPKNDERTHLEEKLVRQIARTSIQYGVLEPDDRVLVAVSGGKDSSCLLHLLDRLRPRLPFSLDLIAVHVSQGQPGYDGSALVGWLQERSLPFRIIEEDTYAVVVRNTVEGQTPCSVCSRMRRGILYTWAGRLGCNKVALGHHRDDAIETLLLNLFYGGKIQAMPARYTTNDGRFEVIRPLIEAAERDLARLARLLALPIVPCALCANQPDHQRTAVGELLDRLEERIPHVRNSLLAALKNIAPTHLLDRELLANVRAARREP